MLRFALHFRSIVNMDADLFKKRLLRFTATLPVVSVIEYSGYLHDALLESYIVC